MMCKCRTKNTLGAYVVELETLFRRRDAIRPREARRRYVTKFRGWVELLIGLAAAGVSRANILMLHVEWETLFMPHSIHVTEQHPRAL